LSRKKRQLDRVRQKRERERERERERLGLSKAQSVSQSSLLFVAKGFRTCRVEAENADKVVRRSLAQGPRKRPEVAFAHLTFVSRTVQSLSILATW
jgi:hypothetical protein